MRSIGVVTGSRADFGIWIPILRLIQSEASGLELRLYATGMHLESHAGLTAELIEKEGFPVFARIPTIQGASDLPSDITSAIARGIEGFGQSFAQSKPDLLLLLGDRYEMFAAAVGALPFGIPMVHLHGGEATEGAYDEAFRHSITKMSLWHFVSTEKYRERVIQLGEAPERVFTVGSPGLDHLKSLILLPRNELEARLGMSLDPKPWLVTFHPVTLESKDSRAQIRPLLDALAATGTPAVFTLPNSDHGNLGLRQEIEAFVAAHPESRSFASLGTHLYFSLMAQCRGMVGNSSSGIIEAASLELPVLNLGSRQAGRIRAKNVIDVPNDLESIASGLKTIGTPQFKAGLKGLVNPYGQGNASQAIVSRLKKLPLSPELIKKKFHDL